MCVIGDTGSGKTTLMYGRGKLVGLLDYRKHAISLRSKGDDAKWISAKRVFSALPSMDDPRMLHIELFPKRGRELSEFSSAIDRIWSQKGGWAVYFDESYHADKLLKLRPKIDDLMTRGRSLGITVINGLQRPVGVSRFSISQAKHVISFGQEGRDAKTIGEATTPRIVPLLEGLRRYQFVWFERADKKLWVGSLQD